MVIDFGSFYDFPRQWDKVFEDFFGPATLAQRRAAYPPLNISENEDHIRIRAEIPGIAMEDIELTLNGKSLVIKGERKAPEGKYFRQERPAGVFQRVVTLNVPVERDNVSARMSSGVLEIVLPKSEAVKPKKIDIQMS